MAVKDFHVPWSHLHCYWCKYRTYITEVTYVQVCLLVLVP